MNCVNDHRCRCVSCDMENMNNCIQLANVFHSALNKILLPYAIDDKHQVQQIRHCYYIVEKNEMI